MASNKTPPPAGPSEGGLLKTEETPAGEEALHRHRAAWALIVKTLDNLAYEKELVFGAPGAANFVMTLRIVCADIGASLNHDSCDEAMKKLEAGFRRFKTLEQHKRRGRAEALEWVRSEWRNCRSSYNDNKTDFARHYVERLRRERDVIVTQRVLAERWLKG